MECGIRFLKKMFDQENYLACWLFASHAHKHQYYPGNNLPYLTHIGSVVMEVLAVADSIENIDLAISCALLHDTIEDTEITYDDVVSAFSETVAEGVMALTKNAELPNKEDRMIDSLTRIQQQSKSVWVVKLADRISNLGKPPHYWDLSKKQKYAEEAGMILDYLGDANKLLAERLNGKIQSYQDLYC